MSTSGGVGGRGPQGPLLPDLCATHVMCLGGASPLRAVMSGTVRLSKGVGREAESEGSEEACLRDGSSDPTNRNRIQGQRDVGHRAMDRDAHSHSDITRVNPAGPEPRTHRLTVGGLPVRLRRLSAEQSGEMGMEKSAEAVVVRRGKTPRDVSLATTDQGPNRLMQEAVSENSMGRRDIQRRQRRGCPQG